MKIAKKIVCFLLVSFIVTGCFYSIPVSAAYLKGKEKLPTPKISVKLVAKKTGAKLTIGKTAGATYYHIYVSGTPTNTECKRYIRTINLGHPNNIFLDNYKSGYDFYIDKDGTKKRSYIFRNLEPGTYTIKVAACNQLPYIVDYAQPDSDFAEITFTVKDGPKKGYSKSYDFSKVEKGDIVKFGAYEQDLVYTNGKEPIEWIVLDKTNDSVLLLSKYILDMLPYHTKTDESAEVTWESCTLRKWLNKDFISSAFNKIEQKMVKSTIVKNADNSKYGTPGGNDTIDKVFLLSGEDVINSDFGFFEDSNESRLCAFAWERYMIKPEKNYPTADGWGGQEWWLRSPGKTSEQAMRIYDWGEVSSLAKVGTIGGVRPVIYVTLKP